MSEHGYTQTLQQIAEAIIDCEHKTAPTQESGIPLIRTTDIENGRLALTSANRVSEEDYRIWSARMEPLPGDIILAREAPVGEVGIIPPNQRVCLGQRTVLIRIDPKIADPRYVLYLLCTPRMKHVMTSRASGSVVSHLNMEDIRVLPLPELPELSEQQMIGSVLGRLDDKIELNQRMINTLGMIGQTVFKHWFINFEFPNEEGKPYKSSGGAMINSDMGNIPKGWRTGKLADYLNTLKGCSYRSDDLKESKIALVTLKSFNRGGGFNQEGYKEYVGEYNEDQVLCDGEIVVAQTDLTQKAEVIGRPAIVSSLGNYSKLVASLDLQIVRPKDNFSHNYAYYLLNTDDFHNHALSYTNGTTVLHLNKNAVADYLAIIPSRQVLDKFDKLVNSISKKIANSATEVRTLSNLRDSLLPKLISRKIQVPVEVE